MAVEYWFSSDLHFDHDNIIKFCNRPFKNSEEMNEALIEKHNARVKPEDHWTCLGDVTLARKTPQIERFVKLVQRLNGHKRLIGGNHDHFPVEVYLQAGFEKIYAMNMYDNLRFTHIPIHPGSMGMAAGNVHGHIHDLASPEPVIVTKNGVVTVKPYVNICVEMTDYQPITLGEIGDRVRYEVRKWGDVGQTAFANGFNLSTQHCEICGEQSQRMERYRCPAHADK